MQLLHKPIFVLIMYPSVMISGCSFCFYVSEYYAGLSLYIYDASFCTTFWTLSLWIILANPCPQSLPPKKHKDSSLLFFLVLLDSVNVIRFFFLNYLKLSLPLSLSLLSQQVIGNVYNRVGQIFYGFVRPPLRIDRRQGKPRNQHNQDLCQACKEGLCKEEWSFSWSALSWVLVTIQSSWSSGIQGEEREGVFVNFQERKKLPL